MAGSIPILGQSNFGALVTSGNQGADAQFYAANSLARTGDLIAKSLAEIQANKEAQQLAPIFRAQYSEGMNEIMSGNVAGGLSRINGTAMQAAQNPLLTRIATESAQAAGYVANNIVDRFSQEARLNFQSKFEEQKQGNRQELALYKKALDLASPQKEKELTVNGKLRAIAQFNKQMDDYSTRISDARNAGDTKTATQLAFEKAALTAELVQKGIVHARDNKITPSTTKDEEAELERMSKAVAELKGMSLTDKVRADGAGYWDSRVTVQQALDDYEQKNRAILDRARDRAFEEAQELGLPVGEDLSIVNPDLPEQGNAWVQPQGAITSINPNTGLPQRQVTPQVTPTPRPTPTPQNTQGGYRRAADLFGN